MDAAARGRDTDSGAKYGKQNTPPWCLWTPGGHTARSKHHPSNEWRLETPRDTKKNFAATQAMELRIINYTVSERHRWCFESVTNAKPLNKRNFSAAFSHRDGFFETSLIASRSSRWQVCKPTKCPNKEEFGAILNHQNSARCLIQRVVTVYVYFCISI